MNIVQGTPRGVMVRAARSVAAIDEMDRGLDKLRTAWLALHARDLLTDEAVEAIADIVNEAINALEPVREELKAIHGAN
jgi:hypothetical protein